MRAFISCEIDLANRVLLKEWLQSAQKVTPNMRWTEEDQLHLTLQFLGEISPLQANQLSALLEEVLEDFQSFSLEFADLFALGKPPRILALKLRMTDQLAQLVRQIHYTTQRIGILSGQLAYRPHITLGRLKASYGEIMLGNWPELPRLSTWQVREIYLKESILGSKGAKHHTIESFILNG